MTQTNKNIQDLFKTYVAKSAGEEKFRKAHVISTVDNNDEKLGPKDDQFIATTKTYKRDASHHGYDAGGDEKMYSEQRLPEVRPKPAVAQKPYPVRIRLSTSDWVKAANNSQVAKPAVAPLPTKPAAKPAVAPLPTKPAAKPVVAPLPTKPAAKPVVAPLKAAANRYGSYKVGGVDVTSDVNSIAKANKISNPNIIRAGQTLKVGDQDYTVQKGDTLSGIAAKNKQAAAPAVAAATQDSTPPPAAAAPEVKSDFSDVPSDSGPITAKHDDHTPGYDNKSRKQIKADARAAIRTQRVIAKASKLQATRADDYSAAYANRKMADIAGDTEKAYGHEDQASAYYGKRAEYGRNMNIIRRRGNAGTSTPAPVSAPPSERAQPTYRMAESRVPGVAAGSMEGKKHMCATKVFHKEWNEGTPIAAGHADPDTDGLIEWYDVMFDHGIERVMTEDMQILQAESHMHSNRKMNEQMSPDDHYKADLPNILKDIRGKRKGHSDLRREYGGSWKRLANSTADEHGHNYNRDHLLAVGKQHMEDHASQINEMSSKMKMKLGLYGKKKKMEEEQIDEVTQKRKEIYGRYINKAKDSIDMASYRSGIKDGTAISRNDPYTPNNPLERKLSKRHKGISRAVAQLTKEEAEDDKLSIAIKKKLSDEGGAAAFKPLKDAAMKMGINLTPEMLKNISGVSQHNDGDYILDESALHTNCGTPECCGQCDTVDQIDEKKLTKAELAKREEVAAAMEREDPGMDMGKKMAIATAQAKKVAEEIELGEAVNSDDAFDRLEKAGAKDAKTTSGGIRYTHGGKEYNLRHNMKRTGHRTVRTSELEQHLDRLQEENETNITEQFAPGRFKQTMIERALDNLDVYVYGGNNLDD